MSLYRCRECKSGRHLYAYSQAVAYGPVHADGLLADHDDVSDAFLFVDSIQCRVHPSGVIETKVDGRFHVWVRCEGRCKGEPEKLRERGWYSSCPDCGNLGGYWHLPLATDDELCSSPASASSRSAVSVSEGETP